jgi:hypothetical protein
VVFGEGKRGRRLRGREGIVRVGELEIVVSFLTLLDVINEVFFSGVGSCVVEIAKNRIVDGWMCTVFTEYFDWLPAMWLQN